MFRFRDLIADTLGEHRGVISEQGSCWWGWWRRPSEGDKVDFWRELKTEVASGKEVAIGLFNSGDGQVTEAIVTEVLLPGEALDDTEKEKVPTYYRQSPFSHAWMRLKSIERMIAAISVR